VARRTASSAAASAFAILPCFFIGIMFRILRVYDIFIASAAG
jgi:hypothetical protein